MALPILVRDSGGEWREPEVTSYENEAALQDLVKGSPDLLSGETMATVDEFWVPSIGSVDIVGVGAGGAITLVECKLRANPEIRREVVGQLLAYAGGLWQMTYDDFASTWESRAGVGLLDHVLDTTGADGAEAVRTGVVAALARGEFTLVIAVDEITSELKRIIEYLNASTKDAMTVLGLELQYVKQAQTEILIPRTYGDSLVEVKRKGGNSSGHRWNSQSFAAEVEKLPENERKIIQLLMEHGQANGDHPWWGVGQTPGMPWCFRGWCCDGQPVPDLSEAAGRGGRSEHWRAQERDRSRRSGRTADAQLTQADRWIKPHIDHVTAESLNRYPNIPVTGSLTSQVS